MSKKIENYSIGLDLGTNSVGWAVIDENYNLVKLKGKDAWGAFLFEKASTAKDRRLKRGQRRRYERRRERISLLQELLSGAVYKADPNFYIKLSESSYRMGEGCYFRDNRYNLFDGDYTDRDFYNDKNSLTIYHLRNHLMTCDTKEDIRKIYLAILHIIKYRGNFLYQGKKIEVGAVLDEQLKSLFELLLNDYEIDLRYTDKLDKLKGILKDKKIFKSDKKKQILALFADSYEKDEKIKKDFIVAFTNAILGYNTNLTSLVLSEEKITEEGSDKEISFNFSDPKYDESEDMYLQLADDKEPLFTAVKAVYTAILFDDVMQGEEYISRAMIAKYEKHKEDLKVLKELLRNNNYSIEVAEDKKSKSDENESDAKTNKSKKTMPVYSWFFRTNKGATYLNYVGTVNSEVRYSKKISRKQLCDSVKSILEKIPDCEAKAYCLREIELGNFLPKLNDVANGAIPYQMNLVELEKIIDNQGRFYPELKENKEKIISLLTFKRPYYIGTFKGKYSWIDQTITERITPWNYKELIEDSGIADAAAENFILRMTNDCQYLPDEKALPKNSILYQAYSSFFYRLVHIKGNLMCRSSLHHLPVVPHCILAVSLVSARNTAGIPCLDIVHAHILRPFICIFQLPFIIRDVCPGLMVADDTYALFPGIFHHPGDIKVRIWLREVETLHSSPAFPALIPAFEHHSLNIVLSGKVYVFQCILSRGSMPLIHLPGLHSSMHSPPYADILHRLYPVRILKRTRLVEIQYQGGIHKVHCPATDLDCPPRGLEGASREPCLHPVRPRSKAAFKYCGSCIPAAGRKGHLRIVLQSSLMHASVKSPVGRPECDRGIGIRHFSEGKSPVVKLVSIEIRRN